MVNYEESDYYKDLFFMMNTSFTGLLTRMELQECFWYHGFSTVTMYEIDIILSLLDTNNSGKVSFSEFLVTAVDPIKYLTRDKVTKAFRAFDKDNSGSITV